MYYCGILQVSQRRMGDYEASHRDERFGPSGMHLLTLMEHSKFVKKRGVMSAFCTFLSIRG